MKTLRRADIDWDSDEPVRVLDAHGVEFMRPRSYRQANRAFWAAVFDNWRRNNKFLRGLAREHALSR